MRVVQVACPLPHSLQRLLLGQTPRGRGSVPENLCCRALSHHSHGAFRRGTALLEVNKQSLQYRLCKGKGHLRDSWLDEGGYLDALHGTQQRALSPEHPQ